MAEKVSFDIRLMETPVARNERLLRVYLYLKAKAVKQKDGATVNMGQRGDKKVELKKGQCTSCRNQDATALSMPPSTYRNILSKLERVGILDNQKDNQNSIITICEERYLERVFFEKVQHLGQPKGQPNRKCSEESLKLSSLLADLILENNPKNSEVSNGSREASVNRWAVAIDMLNRVNRHSWDDIELVIRWSQKDTFWCHNILSGNKLREKFNQLYPKASAFVGGRGKDKKEDSYLDY